MEYTNSLNVSLYFVINEVCLTYSTMLEPSPRYSPASVGGGPTTRLQLDTSLETAVDLSRKTATSDIGEADQDDSEDEAPLDLKVRRSIMIMHVYSKNLMLIFKQHVHWHYPPSHL